MTQHMWVVLAAQEKRPRILVCHNCATMARMDRGCAYEASTGETVLPDCQAQLERNRLRAVHEVHET